MNGLHDRDGGLCRTKNMRIKFEIVADPNRSIYLPNLDVSSQIPNDLTTTSISTSTLSTTENSAMEVYLQKLSTDKPSKMNVENSKWWRLLTNEERRHLIDNTVESYEIDSRPQSDERMVVKPFYLTYSGNDASQKGQTTSRPSQVVLYEVHESKQDFCSFL